MVPLTCSKRIMAKLRRRCPAISENQTGLVVQSNRERCPVRKHLLLARVALRHPHIMLCEPLHIAAVFLRHRAGDLSGHAHDEHAIRNLKARWNDRAGGDEAMPADLRLAKEN